MDPDANLKEQRELSASILKDIFDGERPNTSDVDRLCELVQAMDGWLSNGGFLPLGWSPQAGHNR